MPPVLAIFLEYVYHHSPEIPLLGYTMLIILILFEMGNRMTQWIAKL